MNTEYENTNPVLQPSGNQCTIVDGDSADYTKKEETTLVSTIKCQGAWI